MTLEEKAVIYQTLTHAMQAGVAMEMELHSQPTTPKHLRVGVNVAMSDIGGLCRLLIAKGVFTEDELYDAMIEGMKDEVKAYEKRLSEHYGRPITLGGIPGHTS